MSQAVEAGFVRAVRTDFRLGQVVERMKLARALFLYFQEEQSRYAEEILCRFAHILSFENSSRDPVDGFVRVIFRKRAAPPLEEPDQVASRLLINIAGALSLAIKCVKQL